MSEEGASSGPHRKRGGGCAGSRCAATRRGLSAASTAEIVRDSIRFRFRRGTAAEGMPAVGVAPSVGLAGWYHRAGRSDGEGPGKVWKVVVVERQQPSNVCRRPATEVCSDYAKWSTDAAARPFRPGPAPPPRSPSSSPRIELSPDGGHGVRSGAAEPPEDADANGQPRRGDVRRPYHATNPIRDSTMPVRGPHVGTPSPGPAPVTCACSRASEHPQRDSNPCCRLERARQPSRSPAMSLQTTWSAAVSGIRQRPFLTVGDPP